MPGPPEPRRLDDAGQVVVGGGLRQLAEATAGGADDVRARADVGTTHLTAHRAWTDVGDALAQPGRHRGRQVVHLSDAQDERVGPRQQHAPHVGVLGHRPPGVARRPAQAGDRVGRPRLAGRVAAAVESAVAQTFG